MTRITGLALALVTGLMLAAPPASGAPLAPTSPTGDDDNALGTLRWLPTNSNEKPTGADVFRLVIVHDVSLDENGNPVALKGKGPFGVKFFTTSPDVRMVGHSPSVRSLDDLTGQSQLGPVDERFMGVSGDVRKGACSKLGTPDFSKAYSTTRSFFHPGTEPYQPISAPGTCESVDSSIAITDGQGNVIGYNTTVTNHVPGFWIDVAWPTRSHPGLPGSGRFLAEIWYATFYDEDGQDGEWYATGDTTSTSVSVFAPGEYDYVYSFTANPGGMGPSCTDWGVPDQPGTWQDVTVPVPQGTSRVTFLLFPKGDWDLIVVDPVGTVGIAGNWAGLHETEVVPSAGQQNIPELVPGPFTMRACNFSGETTVWGAVIIE